MDTFIEQLVTKKIDNNDKIKIFLLTVALILAIVLVFIVIGLVPSSFMVLGLFAEAGIIYGYWYLLTSFRVEFEYALTNGELDVDRIVAKRKRKRLITVKIKEIEIMAPVAGYENDTRFLQKFKTVIDASSSISAAGTYFMVLQHEKLGFTKFIFLPDARIMEICKATVPRKVFDK